MRKILFILFVLGLPSLASAATINLSWRDNADNETSQAIERRLGTAGSTFIEVGKVAANVQSFADTTAGAGILYCYRIKAINDKDGNSAVAYSNEVCLVAKPDGLKAEIP